MEGWRKGSREGYLYLLLLMVEVALAPLNNLCISHKNAWSLACILCSLVGIFLLNHVNRLELSSSTTTARRSNTLSESYIYTHSYHQAACHRLFIERQIFFYNKCIYVHVLVACKQHPTLKYVILELCTQYWYLVSLISLHQDQLASQLPVVFRYYFLSNFRCKTSPRKQ